MPEVPGTRSTPTDYGPTPHSDRKSHLSIPDPGAVLGSQHQRFRASASRYVRVARTTAERWVARALRAQAVRLAEAIVRHRARRVLSLSRARARATDKLVAARARRRHRARLGVGRKHPIVVQADQFPARSRTRAKTALPRVCVTALGRYFTTGPGRRRLSVNCITATPEFRSRARTRTRTLSPAGRRFRVACTCWLVAPRTMAARTEVISGGVSSRMMSSVKFTGPSPKRM